MNIDKIRNQVISTRANLLSALKQMEAIDRKLLFVFDDKKFINILSIGDIQRAVFSDKPMETLVVDVLRKDTNMCNVEDSVENIKEKMLELRTECMPVLNRKGELADVIFWEDIFLTTSDKTNDDINLPVVIMAGGKVQSMKANASILPKPLIPIGDKTIIEDIMDRFIKVGCHNFHVIIDSKADMVKQFMESINNKSNNISYLQEQITNGTISGLSMLKGILDKTFFVTNCDISISKNYSEILKYHRDNKNELTIVSVRKLLSAPYGIIELESNGSLGKMTEESEKQVQINSGFYIMEPKLLNEIESNKAFHINDLIYKIQKGKGNVGIFSIIERDCIELSRWTNYMNSFKKGDA
jgi:choline kinase